MGFVCVLAATTPAWADGFASSTDVMLTNVRAMIDAKDYPEAERLAQEVTDASPGLLDAWMLLGYTRTLNSKFEASNEAYEKALDLGADRKEVFTLKAYNCRRMGDAEMTRECYREILEVDENNVDVLMQFGAYESLVENYESAVTCFEAVLRIQPDHFDAIDAIAKAEEKRG